MEKYYKCIVDFILCVWFCWMGMGIFYLSSDYRWENKKNSGFLNGPIVPIYGVGALSVSLLFSVHETYLSIFIGGAFVACVIEYFTSWAMEKLYHRRWWDYSDKAFNVNGRVCLEGFLVFGLFSVVAVKFIQPALMERILNHGMLMLVVVATSLTTLLVLDMIVTIMLSCD